MVSGLENPTHLLLLLFIILLLFGARRLPEIGRSVGSGMREFKDGILGKNENEDENRELSEVD
jgi:sec-independent protein translocase protein TatA